MPPLLSSLAAALLRPNRPPRGSAEDVFALNVAQMSGQPAHVRSTQHPLVSLSVAFSLFLLGRGTANRLHSRKSSRQTQPLPVKLDISASDAVEARLVDDQHPPQMLLQQPSALVRSAEQQVDLAHVSDLRAKKRHITIVTTAAIPWMTGTSVNPALRAVYLAKDGHHVTLVVPWLATPEEQRKLFSKGSPVFQAQQQQREFIQNWGSNQVSGITFDVCFYSSVYSDELGSIMPVGAITDVFVQNDIVRDVCILEEPEHLTWHHSGRVWPELFRIVVGIIHTNYIEYAKEFGFFGPQKALALLFLNVWVCRGYCHRIIKLSDAVQAFPNSITSNVHGVRDRFITIGRNRKGAFPRGAYFMGKVLWAKGYRDLIDNMVYHYNVTGEALHIDFFGGGPDVDEVAEDVEREEALTNVTFSAKVANPTGEYLRGYKVFVNASRSDVVCTATAEALAMGKLVVCLEHPSNAFFATFSNCLTYRTPKEFGVRVKEALSREPEPLSESDAHRLTWEAATERLYDAMRVPLSKSKRPRMDDALGHTHATLSKLYLQPGKKILRAMSEGSNLNLRNQER